MEIKDLLAVQKSIIFPLKPNIVIPFPICFFAKKLIFLCILIRGCLQKLFFEAF